MSGTHTLHLGTVTLTGHARGPLIEVTVGQDNLLTIPEWTSLQAVVDVLAAADREMARLRALVGKMRPVYEAALRLHRYLKGPDIGANDEIGLFEDDVDHALNAGAPPTEPHHG